jgi:sialate O-acetylesterase
MIAPLLPLSLRGFLFYQGESNAATHATYAARFRALISDWRARFESSSAPFYFVQLASFTESADWPHLRQAQDRALAEPETGRVVTLDIGDQFDIHPRNKREVGRRLALLALRRTYGHEQIKDSGPELEAMSVTSGRVQIRWKNSEGLRTTDGEAPRGFEVVGSEGQIVPVSARLEGETIMLEVEIPIQEVRYAFRDFVDVNLVNAAGLPAAPFRGVRGRTP